MFIREKRIGAYSYIYLVETVREGGKTKQRIIRNLGRKEDVEAAGDLDRLARSAARLAQRSMVLSAIEDGATANVTCRRIGAPLLFERLWQESGCRAVLEGLLAERRFEFAVERANYYHRIEAEVVHLALAGARKILHREAQLDPMLLAGIVRVALEKIDGATSVKLRIHPQHAAEWRRLLSAQLESARQPEIVEDPAQPLDRCSLETSMEIGRAHV